ncbi:hypothetical protein, partial [Paenibacillus zanthoxyli]|uniref:hypothetical protein n=1 Tax=Paenibacillus zanthoxyli TaxID=369399 RepID=UPI0012EC6E41
MAALAKGIGWQRRPASNWLGSGYGQSGPGRPSTVSGPQRHQLRSNPATAVGCEPTGSREPGGGSSRR